MNTAQLTNKTVKAAIDALQKGDQQAWLRLFTPEAELYDDGSKRDFMKFSRSAIGEERFTNIDRVDNDGKDIYGNFHTYFKFHINEAGKIYRLDIGQAP